MASKAQPTWHPTPPPIAHHDYIHIHTSMFIDPKMFEPKEGGLSPSSLSYATKRLYTHIYIYIYIHYIYVYMNKYVYTYIFTHIDGPQHWDPKEGLKAVQHLCHMRMTLTHTHIYIYTHMYMYVHIYTYMYTCIFTQISSPIPSMLSRWTVIWMRTPGGLQPLQAHATEASRV